MVVECMAEEEDKSSQSDLPYTFLMVGSATATVIEHAFLSSTISCNSCSALGRSGKRVAPSKLPTYFSKGRGAGYCVTNLKREVN